MITPSPRRASTFSEWKMPRAPAGAARARGLHRPFAIRAGGVHAGAMPAPFPALPDPELAEFEERFSRRRQDYLRRALTTRPAALPEGLPARVLDQALKNTGADEGSLWLAVDDAAALLPVWNNGPDAARFVASFRLPAGAGITGLVFTSGLAVCESEVCFHERQNRALDAALGVLTWAMLAVPLRFAGEVRGVVTAVRLIRLAGLPEVRELPRRREDLPPGVAVPEAFSVDDLAAMETAAQALGRLLDHRLSAWALGWED